MCNKVYEIQNKLTHIIVSSKKGNNKLYLKVRRVLVNLQI